MSDGAAPPNPVAYARLENLVRELGGSVADAVPGLPPLAETISGQTFEFEENGRGLRTMNLKFTPGAREASIDVTVGFAKLSLSVGLDGGYRYTEMYDQRWACRGRWVDDGVFVVEQEAMGKVVRRQLTMNFENDGLSLEIHNLIDNSVEMYNASLN